MLVDENDEIKYFRRSTSSSEFRISNKICIRYKYTVRPLLSAELDYPRFLRPNLSTPNLYELPSDLHDSHLYYARF